MNGNVKKFLDEIKVYDCAYIDLMKIRIGNRKDGGYVVLEELCKKTGMLYSFGIGDDVSFETDFAERFPDADIRLFDPTIASLPKKHQRFTFLKCGIGLKYERLAGVADGSLLKIDIEWDEWGTFLVFDEAELLRFSQIVAEFHVVHVVPNTDGYTPYFRDFYQSVADKITEDVFAMYYETMARLNRGFRIFHIHANNSLPRISVGGYRFPPLMELSFVRKDLVPDARVTTGNFPVKGLDFPNKPDRPDITDYYPLGMFLGR